MERFKNHLKNNSYYIFIPPIGFLLQLLINSDKTDFYFFISGFFLFLYSIVSNVILYFLIALVPYFTENFFTYIIKINIIFIFFIYNLYFFISLFAKKDISFFPIIRHFLKNSLSK